VPNTGMIKIEK